MPDKSVVVRVKADVAGYISSVQAASRATADFASQSLAYSLKHKQAFDQVGKASATAGALIVGGLTAAAVAAAKFDEAMSVVKANVDDKTAPSMKRLADAALEAGRTTVFSAIEAAQAENELAKAGLSSSQIVGGALTAALTLASAGQLDLATAAETVSSTMVQFNLQGKDAAHVADVLAAGADKSLGGVTDLSEALKYAGVVSSQFGISLDSTTGVLAQFASNGILGSMAGTGLRQILLSLAAPTQQATETMNAYGISVFDAQGRFVGLAGLAQQLHDKLGGLSQQEQQAALATIFTNRSIAEANILMKDGADGVDRWTNAVNDQGFAAGQAAQKLDNLNGDLKKLKNNFQVALIDTGQEAQGPLREVVQDVTGVIRAYDSLSSTGKEVVVSAGLIVGGITLVGGAALIALPKIAAFNASLRQMTGAATTGAAVKTGLGRVASFLVGPWGLALGAGVTALGIFAKSHIDAARRVGELTDAIRQDSGAVGDNTKQLVANKLEKDGVLKTGQKLGVSLDVLTAAATGNTDAMREATQALADHGHAAHVGAIEAVKYLGVLGNTANDTNKAAAAAKRISAATDESSSSAKNAATQYDALGRTVDSTATKVEAALPSADDLANAILGVKAAAKGSIDELDVLSRVLDGLIGIHTDAERAAIQFQASIDAITQAVKENGRVLDINTDKGRAVMGAVLDAADAAEKDAEAKAKETGSVEQASAVYAAHVEQLRKTLTQAGLNKKAVDELINKYANVPPDVFTKIVADTRDANTKIATVNSDLAKLPASTVVKVVASVQGIPAQIMDLLHGRLSLPVPAGSTRVTARAAGGAVDGPGTKTSDSVLIRASRGEYVMQASAVDHYGVGFMAAVNARRFAHGGVVGYAAGGQVFNPGGGSLVDQASRLAARGAPAADLQALLTAYDEYLHKLDQAAQREKLVGDIAAAKQELATAKTKDRAAAQQKVNDTIKALQDFDSAAYVDAQKASVDKLVTSLQDEASKLQSLNDMLDKQADISKQMAASTQKYYADMAKAAADFHAKEAELVNARASDIENWAKANEVGSQNFAYSVATLTGNVAAQADQIKQWTQLLQDARDKGLSQSAIEALGLDQGPQAINQLKEFTGATKEQIDALNKAVGDKSAAAASEAAREQANGYGQLGRDLLAAQADYNAQVEQLQKDYQAEQADLTAQMAQIGADQGRSYGEAIAAGLASSIPAVQAAAAQLRAAMTGTQAAGYVQAGTAGHVNAAPGTALYLRQPDGTFLHLSPGQYAAQPPGTPIYVQRAGGGYIDGPGGKTSDSIVMRASRGEYMMQASSVDRFGLGFMNAINAGRLPFGPPVVNVRVFIGGRELTGDIRTVVDGAISDVVRRIEAGAY